LKHCERHCERIEILFRGGGHGDKVGSVSKIFLGYFVKWSGL